MFRKGNKIQLKMASSSHCIYTFHPGNRGKHTNILHILFKPASVRGRKTGSSVPLCRTQAFSCSCFPKKSTRPLPAWVATPLPFASDFPPLQDAEMKKKISKTRAMSHWIRLINCTNLKKMMTTNFPLQIFP